ncbi:MAG: hypothetical protein NTU69_08520 [Proteobacteria bacterium]|nr:hypothetical protein [Pseudomonadota bacterium]
MDDTEEIIEAKKVVSRYEDRISRHGGDSLENIMQTYFETILYMGYKIMLKRPGEIIPMVIKGKEERDFFFMILRKVDLPPDICAIVVTPSGREKIGPQIDKNVDLFNKESSMLVISHYQKRDRVFHVALPGLLSIGTDIYEDGNLICSYDYNTIDECLNELSKIVWNYLGPKEALSKEQIIQYTENWFAKSEDIFSLKNIPVHKEFNYLYHPELIGMTLPKALLKAMAAALLKKNDLDRVIYNANDFSKSCPNLNLPVVTKKGIMKNIYPECKALLGQILSELEVMFDVLESLPDIELAYRRLWRPEYNRTIFDKTGAEIYQTLTGQPYPGNPTA